MLGAGRTEHGKGQHKDHHLCAAVERAAEDVVVLFVPGRVVAPQPELRDEPDDDVGGHGGVDADVHPGRVLWCVCIKRSDVSWIFFCIEKIG